jgi:SAM-dependent methyltransferase
VAVSRDTKQAEKDYLSRSGSLAWEQVKPFSPPATDTLAESVRLMHDFAVALNALDPSGSDLIVDLGVGSGWTSEWLARLNLSVVSVDIALEMLKVGQARCRGRNVALAAGDFEALPFRSGSFDRALCLNALHHAPRPGQALKEIARVLNDEGRLVLIEPGHGHAQRDTSQAAMSEYGVLEQDLEATMLMRLCHEAGFSHVTVRPLSYMSGEIDLSLDELSTWRSWTRTKRPWRAMRKLWRALMELPGLQKDGLLFEDAMSMWTSRVLMRHIGEQALVVAAKGAPPAAREYRAAIDLQTSPLPARAGVFVGRLAIRNAGNLTWRASSRVGPVRVGVQLLDAARQVQEKDFLRVPLPHDVPPGDECVVHVEVPLPAGTSPLYLKFDLVAEGVAWFETEGSTPLVVPVPPGTPKSGHST